MFVIAAVLRYFFGCKIEKLRDTIRKLYHTERVLSMKIGFGGEIYIFLRMK